MGETKEQKIWEVPEAVGKPWNQSWGRKKRVCDGNDLWKRWVL